MRASSSRTGPRFHLPRERREAADTRRVVLQFPEVTAVAALVLYGFVWAACAPHKPSSHGKITTLSAATSANYQRCPHKLPQEVCTRCNPPLQAKFKLSKDWCPEHGVPESQCFECHPDLTFDPLPPLPQRLTSQSSRNRERTLHLEAHAVKGKVTLFDFYAVWCAPCRKIDAQILKRHAGVCRLCRTRPRTAGLRCP